MGGCHWGILYLLWHDGNIAKFATLISQIAIPADVCSAAYATAAYADSRGNFEGSNSIADDMIFADNGAERIAAMTLACSGSAAAGYAGRAVVGIAT
ncbi:MAG: hypothetical protein IPG54_03230 [Sphingomonadales bacterium]|nr:hypothetical protein [Sphingomonadales bacterium]